MTTLHATSLRIGDKGLLLSGASGSGKSQTALCLMDMAKSAGLAFGLVVDDQTAFKLKDEEIIMQPPSSLPDHLHGTLELRGFGLIKLPFIEEARLDHCFTLHAMVAGLSQQQNQYRLSPPATERPKISIPIGNNGTIARHHLPIFASDMRHSAQIILAEAGFVLPLG